jgi:murein DD-endopeptidase MepM/ murein hydrolase activator NlpD
LKVRFSPLLKTVLLFWFLLGGLSPAGPSLAQDSGPVYIVQEGDTLWSIALRFGVSLQALQDANGIGDPGQIAAGDELVIPGLEGIQGVLTTVEVPYGENLRSLSRRFSVPVDALARLNHLTHPAELYAGATLVVPQDSQESAGLRRGVLAAGQSLLELAVLQGIHPWSLVEHNRLDGTWSALPGDVLLSTANAAEASPDGPGALPGAISSLELRPLPAVQGHTAVISVRGQAGLELGGEFLDYPLKFFADGSSDYYALQGVHAMTEPGFYPLVIRGKLPGGGIFSFSQSVYIRDGDYPFDPVLTVSPETLDPAVTRPEDAQWYALAAPVSPERLWQGSFQSPAPDVFKDCWPSRYGNRRSYNGSEYRYFHTGLDFCGQTGTEIYAPAAGTVVFAGPLTVRGNATMIDHGWGVYTAYMHQSEIKVEVGERVEPGQLIGLVGATGRVTGPHLHWEVFVGGVQVDPIEWLESEFPEAGTPD